MENNTITRAKQGGGKRLKVSVYFRDRDLMDFEAQKPSAK